MCQGSFSNERKFYSQGARGHPVRANNGDANGAPTGGRRAFGARVDGAGGRFGAAPARAHGGGRGGVASALGGGVATPAARVRRHRGGQGVHHAGTLAGAHQGGRAREADAGRVRLDRAPSARARGARRMRENFEGRGR